MQYNENARLDPSQMGSGGGSKRTGWCERERGYRDRALRLLPHVCARCGRDFAGPRLRELTVHHKDHDHHNNPADGSNWEMLCVYCHDDEHMRELEQRARGGGPAARAGAPSATHRPFESLAGLLKERK